jgi:IS605 OrfB family transposase
MILTYRYRVKDSRQSRREELRRQSSVVNFVWNYCCQIQREAERRWTAGCSRSAARWPTYFDLTYLTAGCSTELGVQSETIAGVCRQFIQSRDATKRCPGWRSGRKNLDWVPVNHAAANVRIHDGVARFRGKTYRLWWSRDLPADAKLKTATFACDARGRWYLNLVIETTEVGQHGSGAIGIDLGLKTLATTSAGEVIPNLRHVEHYAAQLATAQRAGNKRRVTAIHAKIANSRRDHLHKVSTRLMRANQCIVVGNVSASKLAKTKMAKSVLDAGWSSFRSYLAYKALRHQVAYAEVDEAFTSQVCSACGSLPASRPKGIADLGVRRWDCSECGASHDRDVNAARNILRVGLARQPLVEGIAA